MKTIAEQMKTTLGIIPLSAALMTGAFAQQPDGEALFKQTCMACHTVGKGKLVGPDLKGVTERFEQAWLIPWIQSSQTLVKKGDERAVKLFEENNKIPMPDNPYSEEQVLALLDYIRAQSTVAAGVSAAASVKSEGGGGSVTNQETPAPAEGDKTASVFRSGITWALIASLILLFIVILVQLHVIRTLTEELKR